MTSARTSGLRTTLKHAAPKTRWKEGLSGLSEGNEASRSIRSTNRQHVSHRARTSFPLSFSSSYRVRPDCFFLHILSLTHGTSAKMVPMELSHLELEGRYIKVSAG